MPNVGSTANFIISFVAIIPLAALLGAATEQCALSVGQTIGGLLNATFGNAVEAIVSIIALSKGELRIVQTSLLGSILSNCLLVLGCSFIAGGLVTKENTFQTTAAGTSSSLMILSCAALIIPAAYHASQLSGGVSGFMHKPVVDDLNGLLTISRGTAIILLLSYASCTLILAPPAAHNDEMEMNRFVLPTQISRLLV